MPTVNDPIDNDTSAESAPLVIPQGSAQLVLSQALDHLTAAYVRLEAVAMACARAADQVRP
jgi:hypothetical protein